MRAYCFCDFCTFFPLAYVDESKKVSDAWYCISTTVDEFNERRAKHGHGHAWKTEDESMSAFCPCATKLDVFPNISFVLRKPESLGWLFCVLFFRRCSVSLIILFFFPIIQVLSSSVQPAPIQAACFI